MIESIEKLRERSHLDDNRWTLSDGRVMWYTNGEPNDPNAVNWGEQMREIADEIEREISERYMELPVDADGVPIHVGDGLVRQYKVKEKPTEAESIIFNGEDWYFISGDGLFNAVKWHHAKPRTLEDVLREYALEMNLTYETGEIGGEERVEALDDLTVKYAAEIRELMEASE